MNKKGLIGKIFAVIGIIILIILIIAGITAYQAYDLYKTAMNEKTNVDSSIQQLQKGDCSKIADIENSAARIKSKANSACWNPIIRIAVAKMEQIPIKCNDLSAMENQMNQGLSQIKTICANETLRNALQKANSQNLTSK